MGQGTHRDNKVSSFFRYSFSIVEIDHTQVKCAIN